VDQPSGDDGVSGVPGVSACGLDSVAVWRDAAGGAEALRAIRGGRLAEEGKPAGWNEGQIVLGSEDFLAKQRDRFESKKGVREHPRMQRQAACPTLAELSRGQKREDGAALPARAREAHVTHRHTLKAVADHLGGHCATTGRRPDGPERTGGRVPNRKKDTPCRFWEECQIARCGPDCPIGSTDTKRPPVARRPRPSVSKGGTNQGFDGEATPPDELEPIPE